MRHWKFFDLEILWLHNLALQGWYKNTTIDIQSQLVFKRDGVPFVGSFTCEGRKLGVRRQEAWREEEEAW